MKIEFTGGREMTATERSAIEDSISTLSSTPYGTAPYARDMGIKEYPPKSTSEIAKNRYATEVITQAARWEDRAKVSEVRYTQDNAARVVMING